MKILLTCFAVAGVLVLVSTGCPKPLVTWAITFGGSGDEFIEALDLTDDGGYIVGGTSDSYYSDSWDCDFYIAKVNGDGSVAWTSHFGGAGEDTGHDVKHTGDGGYVIAGQSLSFSGGSDNDMYVVKTTSAGAFDWDAVVGGPNDDYANAIEQTEDDGYIVAGDRFPPAGGRDGLLVKLDDAGVVDWTAPIGAAYGSSLGDVHQVDDGGYVVAGWYRASATGDRQMYLAKTDDTGAVDWSNLFGGTTDDGAEALALASDGGYFLAGASEVSGDDWDAYIVKTDSAGGFEWDWTFSRSYFDGAKAVAATDDFGCVVLVETVVDASGTDRTILLVKLNAGGAVQWIRPYGGALTERPGGVRQTPDGGYAFAGWTNSFGTPNADAYVVKTNKSGKAPATPTAQP